MSAGVSRVCVHDAKVVRVRYLVLCTTHNGKPEGSRACQQVEVQSEGLGHMYRALAGIATDFGQLLLANQALPIKRAGQI